MDLRFPEENTLHHVYAQGPSVEPLPRVLKQYPPMIKRAVVVLLAMGSGAAAEMKLRPRAVGGGK